ncbi:MAG: Multidrug resistance protein 3 [Candidatus Celerinatantimonas neptuna]|nr:MAG: Multidrug resistance protein 3 [Candidatus Celerinatantimonas neptuna]
MQHSEKQAHHSQTKLTIPAVLIALLMAAMDSTIVTPALPTIHLAMAHSANWPWIMTGFLLPIAFIAPLVGGLSDRFGALTVFRLNILIFTSASLGASLASSMPYLIAARVIQGIGSGGIIVLSYTLLGTLFPPEKRAKVQGLLSAVWGVAAIIGPAVGSLLLVYADWRSIFWLNIPVGLIALFMMSQISSNDLTQNKKSVFIDPVSQFLAVIMMVGLLLTFNSPWHSTMSQSITAGCSLSALMILILRVRPAPQRSPIPTEILHDSKQLCMAALIFLSSANIYATVTLLPGALQHVASHNAAITGMLVTFAALGWVTGSMVCGKVLNESNDKRVILAGSLLLVIAPIAISVSLDKSLYILLASVIFSGMGTGLVATATLVKVQNSAPLSAMGRWTAAVQLLRNLGSVCGISFLTGLYTAHLTSPRCFMILALFMGITVLCSFMLFKQQHIVAPPIEKMR